MKTIERMLHIILWDVASIWFAVKAVSSIPVMGLLGLPHLAIHQHAWRLAFLCCVLTEDSILERIVRDVISSLTMAPPVFSVERLHKLQKQLSLF